MTTQHRPQLPIDGVDTVNVAAFLVDALELMRHRHDLADLCALLTKRVTHVLPIVASAVVLTDGEHGPAVASVAGPSAAGRRTLEAQLDDDLVRECLRTGGSTSRHISLDRDTVTIHVLPISSYDTVFGTLVLLSDAVLPDRHLDVAGIFADVVTVAFLQTSPHLVAASSRARFADLLRSLDVIEQAKGMLSQRQGINVDAAFDGMWQVGLDHEIGLSTLAERVVNRTLDDALAESLTSVLTNRASAPAE